MEEPNKSVKFTATISNNDSMDNAKSIKSVLIDWVKRIENSESAVEFDEETIFPFLPNVIFTNLRIIDMDLGVLDHQKDLTINLQYEYDKIEYINGRKNKA